FARSAPAHMSHKHYRCACLCIEIDHEHSLPARDRQTIGQHHGDCRFSDATAAIGYSDEGGHRGLPKLLVRPEPTSRSELALAKITEHPSSTPRRVRWIASKGLLRYHRRAARSRPHNHGIENNGKTTTQLCSWYSTFRTDNLFRYGND